MDKNNNKKSMNELDDLLINNHNDENKQPFIETLEYIKNNPKISRLIFSSKYSGTLRQKFDDFVESLCKEAWAGMVRIDSDSKKFEYLFRYHIRGCMSIIEKWTEDNFHESEKFIIKIITQIEINARNFISTEVSRKKWYVNKYN